MRVAPLEVVDARPPNFDKILAVFPEAEKPGVMFAYGGKVYAPGGTKVTRELDAHERVHIERQAVVGTEEWWDQYLRDDVFRNHEEFLAHRAEYVCYCRRHADPVKRAKYLRLVATRMASSLYGFGGSVDQWAMAIQFNANPCEPS